MNYQQLVQDVIDGEESALIAFAVMNEKMKELHSYLEEIKGCALNELPKNGIRILFKGGQTFKFEKVNNQIHYTKINY